VLPQKTPQTTFVALLLLASLAAAQQPQPKPEQKPEPKVHVNYLNVCAPDNAQQAQIIAALQRVPSKPGFGTDFEVDRGRSVLEDGSIAAWVRIRHDFAGEASFFSSAQYSFSSDPVQIEETLVFQVRSAKKDELLQLTIHDAQPAGEAKTALAANAPAGRIRLERFGASSVVLARCPGADQSGYETLFRSASDILAKYRSTMNVRDTVPGDLARLPKSSR
jgi:hypothetical protein